MFLLNGNQVELNQEFDELFHLIEYLFLCMLNQQYRLEIDNIHVYERISRQKKIIDMLLRMNEEKIFTTDGRDPSALISM